MEEQKEKKEENNFDFLFEFENINKISNMEFFLKGFGDYF